MCGFWLSPCLQTGALMVESTNAAAVSTDLFNLSIAPIEPTAGSPHSAVASFLSPQLLTGGARQNAANVSVLAPSMALHPPPHPGGDVSVSLVGLTAPPALGSHAHFDEHNHSYGDMGDDYEGGYDDDAYAPSFAKAADGNEMSSAAPMPSHEQSVAHQRPTRRVAATAAMVAAADTQSSSMQEEQVEEEALAGEVDMWAQLDANAPGGGPGATVKPYRRGRTFIVLKNAKLVSHQGARVAAATARAAAGSSGVVKSPVRDAALTGGAILPTRLQSWSMSAFSSHNPLWSELLPLQRRHAANAARERLAALRGPAAGGGTTSSTLMHDPGAVASTLDGMGGDDYEGGYDDAAFEAGGMHSPAGNDDMLRWLDDAPAAAVMEERARTAQAHALTLDEAFDNTVEDGTADYATLVERHMRHIVRVRAPTSAHYCTPARVCSLATAVHLPFRPP
ncbi:hypothetical protein EON66_05490 [archaeon]|nr:MAG: hypothetical protein EON66_05490 [archaeon]